ncbi:unnamed protein product, partial [marine sediment metagenome]
MSQKHDGPEKLQGGLVFPWGYKSIVETFQGREESYLKWLGKLPVGRRLYYLRR